ncbi:MAG: hypothetical protein KGL99_09300 [Burkholderiales bacterium]|nr:hypothetical protein [Burkholderiales bacterium]
MTVALWVPDTPLPSARTVLYRRDDEAAFAQQAQTSVTPGTTVYKVLPNGYPFLDLLRLYLHHRGDPTDAWLEVPAAVSPDHAWLGRNFVRLRLALKHWDDRGATAALTALEKKQALLHPDQIQFIDFCKGFVSRLMQPILWGSPLALTAATMAKARAWWSLPSDLAVEVDAQIQDLRSRFPSQLPLALRDNFHQWLLGLKTWLTTRLFVSKQSDALREASAFCHSLAVIHFGLARYSLALIYCHRAADLLLFSECAASNLIDFTANNGGGALKRTASNDPNVSILNCYDSLVADGTFLLNTKQRAIFSDLNSHRNLLLVAHYMGSVSSPTAKRLLTDVSVELKAIGGPSWNASSQMTRKLIDVEAHEFFGLSAGLMGTLVPG